MAMFHRNSFHCTPFNIDGIHSQMEMLLSSLFDNSYSMEPRKLVASNGSLEYTYVKEAIGNKMSLRVISLEAPRQKFTVEYGGKPFCIVPRVHPLLDISSLH